MKPRIDHTKGRCPECGTVPIQREYRSEFTLVLAIDQKRYYPWKCIKCGRVAKLIGPPKGLR